jgi:hypothetical protein
LNFNDDVPLIEDQDEPTATESISVEAEIVKLYRQPDIAKVPNFLGKHPKVHLCWFRWPPKSNATSKIPC